MGNLRSVSKALEHVAPRAEVVVSADARAIRAAERVVVPGQGALPDCMRSLAASGALGLLAGEVPRLVAPGLKIPHMGWNEVRQRRPHALWRDIPDGSRFYFVHSFYAAPRDPVLTAAITVYGAPFTCAVARDNIFAAQFHPEKSQSAGLQLLSNFVDWRP